MGKRALNLTDKALVKQFLDNRSSAHFSALYRQHHASLMRTAMYLTKYDRARAEDVVQEGWITAIEKLDSFHWRSTLKTWLTGILVNKFREQQRRKRESDWPEEENLRMVESSSPDLSMDLKEAILALPEGYREILTLHDIEGFKHREIADILDIKEGTSKSQLHQARKAMRNLLTGYKTK